MSLKGQSDTFGYATEGVLCHSWVCHFEGHLAIVGYAFEGAFCHGWLCHRRGIMPWLVMPLKGHSLSLHICLPQSA